MKNALMRRGVNGVWHFTDESNIASIRNNGGLLSLAESRQRQVHIPRPGGNQWSHDADRHNGVDNYVHLAFINEHPMLYHTVQDGRTPNPVWLKIHIDVLDTPGTRYTRDVSNQAGEPLLTSENAREQIDLEVLFAYMDWRDPVIRERRNQAKRGEILIPRLIPLNMIMERHNG